MIKPGDIKLLWMLRAYDGMLSAVGVIGDQYVYLDMLKYGGDRKKEWQELEHLLDKLLREEDQSWIDSFFEAHYEEEMYERERTYNVYAMTDEQFSLLQEDHELFQEHVGKHSDYVYVDGVPKLHMVPAKNHPAESDHDKYYKVDHVSAGVTDKIIQQEPLGTVGRLDLYKPKEDQPRWWRGETR